MGYADVLYGHLNLADDNLNDQSVTCSRDFNLGGFRHWDTSPKNTRTAYYNCAGERVPRIGFRGFIKRQFITPLQVSIQIQLTLNRKHSSSPRGIK